MKPGAYIIYGALAFIVLTPVITLYLFRLVLRKLHVKELVEEGIILTENGIEMPGAIMVNRIPVNYEDIESVELVSFPTTLTLGFRYGPSVASAPSARWDIFGDTVVIKFKRTIIKYRLFTPSNPREFVEKLKSRIERSATHSKQGGRDV